MKQAKNIAELITELNESDNVSVESLSALISEQLKSFVVIGHNYKGKRTMFFYMPDEAAMDATNSLIKTFANAEFSPSKLETSQAKSDG